MVLIICATLSILMNMVYTHLLLTRKKSAKHALFIFTINILIVVLEYIILQNTFLYQYITYITGFTLFLYIYLVFEESISKKMFTMFTIWLFSNVIVIISGYVISLFSVNDSNSYVFFTILLRGFIQLLFIPIIYLYAKHSYKEMLKLISIKVVNIISFYSIIIFIFLIRYYQLYSYKPMNSFGFFNSLLFFAIIILSYIIIYLTIWSVNKNMELEYKFKIIDTQLELQKQNYSTLNKSLDRFYSAKHDINHHIMAIKSMMDTKNYIAASEYFKKFTETEIVDNIGMLCSNLTIDSILKYYMGVAMKNNIDFTVNLDIPENINIDNLDLSIVIGNCVVNAIEASNKINVNQKYIDIKAEIKGFNLILVFKNSYNGQVVKEGDIIKTSKKSQGHGIGLSNVRKMAEKYNGFFDVKYTDSEFEVSIILNFS